MERQALNVFRMRLMGAEVRAVESGTKTLKDACSAAIRDWVTNVEDTHYILGSVAGPHPFRMIVSCPSRPPTSTISAKISCLACLAVLPLDMNEPWVWAISWCVLSLGNIAGSGVPGHHRA